MSYLEAYIEFGEDEQIFKLDSSILSSLKSLQIDIKSHLNDNRRGEIVRDGAKVCIVGKPNAGKSSLFNYLVQRKASIVSNIPGTTRDIIQSFLNIGGYAVQLFDTAGIHNSSACPIESEGIVLGMDQAMSADFLVFVIDVFVDQCPVNYFSWLETHMPKVTKDDNFITRSIFLLCKSDLLDNSSLKKSILERWNRKFKENVFLISLKQPDSPMAKFLSALQTMIGNRTRLNESPGSLIIFRERHRYHLSEFLKLLDFAISTLENEKEDELIVASEHLKQSCNQIGHISGKITSEDVLGSLFKDFCVGK